MLSLTEISARPNEMLKEDRVPPVAKIQPALQITIQISVFLILVLSDTW